jgi:zinc protease
MRGSIVVGFVLLLSVSFSAEAQRRKKPSELSPEYFKALKRHTSEGSLTQAVFKNGLTVVVEEHPTSPLAAIVTLIKVGKYSRPATEIDVELATQYVARGFLREISSLGGVSEVSTGALESSFASIVPAEKVPDALEVHTQLLRPPEYNSGDLQLVAESLEGQTGCPICPAKRELLAIYYGQIPKVLYEVPSEEAYEKYCRVSFHPANTVIALSGSLRREEVLEALVGLVGAKRWPRAFASSKPSQLEMTAADALRYRHLRGNVRSPFVFLAYAVPSFSHPDYPAIQLLRYILGEGNSPLLQSPQVEGTTIPFWQRISLEPLPRGELFLFTLVPEKDSVDKAEVLAIAALRSLSDAGPPTSLIYRAKTQMLTDYYDKLSRLDRRAYLLAQYQAAGDFRRRDQIPELIAAVTVEDIKRILHRYFSESRLSVLEYFPNGAEPRTFTEKSFQETLNILLPGETQRELAVLEKFRSEDQPRFQLPRFQSSYSSRELRRTSILRGPEIYLREEHSVPLVEVGLFYPGGRINEAEGDAGITDLMLQALLHNYVRREGRLVQMGIAVETISAPDYFGLQAKILAPFLDEGLWALLNWVRSPRLQEIDVEAARKQLLSRFGVCRDYGTHSLVRSANRSIYEDHPYARGLDDWERNLPEIQVTSVEKWKEQHMEQIHPYVFALGDLDGTSFLHAHVSELSDRQYTVKKGVKVKVKPMEKAAPFESVLESEKGVLAFPGPAAGSDFSEALDVALNLLSDPAGEFLESLRTEQQLASQFLIEREARVNGGGIYFSVSARPEKLKQALDGLREQLKKFSEKPIPEDHFLRSVDRLITAHHYKHQDRHAYIQEMMKAVLAGEPPDYSLRYILNLKQLRMGEVEEALRRFLGDEN